MALQVHSIARETIRACRDGQVPITHLWEVPHAAQTMHDENTHAGRDGARDTLQSSGSVEKGRLKLENARRRAQVVLGERNQVQGERD